MPCKVFMEKSSRAKNLRTKIEISGHEHTCGGCCGGSHGYFFGVLLLVVGAWFLIKELGWIASTFSIWPVILIVFGLWLLVKHNRHKH